MSHSETPKRRAVDVRWVLALSLLGAGSLLSACGVDDGVEDADADAARDTNAEVGDAEDAMVEAGRDSADDASADAATDVDADAGTPSTLAATVYVTVGADDRLAVVRSDDDGALTEREDLRLALPGSPGAMVRDDVTGRLYIGLGDAIATVDVDAEGQPTLAGVTEGTGRPVYLDLANEGATLVSAYYGANRMLSHGVRGAPPHAELHRVDTPDRPHAAWVQSGTVYVPQLGSAEVRWAPVGADGRFGTFESVATLDEEGPRHIAFARGGTLAYVVNEFTDDLTQYLVADGALTRGDTASTLPSEFDGDANTCADVHVHPSGDYAYASNRGHDSIAVFDLAADGAPTLRQNVPTEETPREFDVSPDGRLMVVAGQASGHLASYRIGDDGSPEPVDRLELGGRLLWAIIVPD